LKSIGFKYKSSIGIRKDFEMHLPANYAEAVYGVKHINAGFDTRVDVDVFLATLSMFVKQRKAVKETESYVCKKGDNVLKHVFEDGSESVTGVSVVGLNTSASSSGRVLTMMVARVVKPSYSMQSCFEYDDEYYLNRVSARVPGTHPVYLNFDKRTYLCGEKQYGISATEKAPPGATGEWIVGSMKRVEAAIKIALKHRIN
jgi:hypothetical protein